MEHGSGRQIAVPRGAADIPTEDAEEALRFCRGLSAYLARSENASPGQCSSPLEPSSIPDVSVVTAVFNEELNIKTFYERLVSTLEPLGLSFEIVFVDDGSTDGSTNILSSIAGSDSRVILVEFTRNFGQQIAFSAGMDYARGRAVVVMDSDLQDSPEVVPALIAKWREGLDVVYAVRMRRKEHWSLRLLYGTFYRLLRLISDIDIPLDAGDFCIMDRAVVDLVRSLPERNRFLRGIRSWVGFSQMGVPVEREARHAGKRKYSLLQLVRLALDGLVSFSFVPLRLISVLGIAVSFFSVGLAAIYGIRRAVYGLGPAGFATTIVLLSLFAGIQLITIGVIGEYVGRMFIEIKHRPLYVIRKVTNCRY